MSQEGSLPTFGVELKDAFKPVNAWVTHCINWLEDIHLFYRERSVIEKEYSQKLSALAKKYHEKKARRSGTLSVGDTPTLTPGSLESASLTTWTTQLTTLEKRAAEHDRFASELITQIADPIRNNAVRFEDLRKSHAEYAVRLEKEKDAAFGALKRSKTTYDGVCSELESKRKKMESSYDSSKAQSAYNQQLSDMHNVKNTYLISINVTNKQKQKYYYEYVPDLLDSMQDLSETRVAFLNKAWTIVTKHEIDCLSRSLGHLNQLTTEIQRNEPHLDSMMFLKHNQAAWQEPPDMGFEAAPVWHDDAVMAVDETSKVFLRNILGKSKGARADLRREVEQKRKEVANARAARANIRAGKDNRDEVDAVKAIFALQEQLHESERKWLSAEVEISTITTVVGDISLGAKNHNFKSQTFKIPTNCDLCGERIWGLSAKGFDCRDCGYTCHSKCELKVPADCPGEQSKEDRKRLKSERQATANSGVSASTNGGHVEAGHQDDISRTDTMNSLSSGYAASAHRSVSGKIPGDIAEVSGSTPTTEPAKPRRNRVVAPPPTSYVSSPAVAEMDGTSSNKSPEQKGRMLYAYQASGDGEITVHEGDEFSVVEPDDGSGWLSIRTTHSAGLVPTTYTELHALTTPSSSQFLPERPSSLHSTNSSAGGSTHASSSTTATSAAKKKGPAVAPRRGAKKLLYVEALYDYEARSEAEWSMTEGERFVLVNKDSGDGWADVERAGVVKAVPASYVRQL